MIKNSVKPLPIIEKICLVRSLVSSRNCMATIRTANDIASISQIHLPGNFLNKIAQPRRTSINSPKTKSPKMKTAIILTMIASTICNHPLYGYTFVLPASFIPTLNLYDIQISNSRVMRRPTLPSHNRQSTQLQRSGLSAHSCPIAE